MCKVHVAAVRALILPIVLCGMVWAQGFQNDSEVAGSRDVFAAWHANLSNAADRVLMSAVADKPRMKVEEAAVNGASPASNKTLDPAVRLRTAIQRIQLLRPTIEPFLHSAGVPAELSAVVLVESGGQPVALSPKGARGIWQFMPDTARRYGTSRRSKQG
jgi:hypothetical protein